ncbi:uncharacterized protein PRCAT00002622001 [Priceomyces carsonii]|uniref:uncharacterized protein n=1 Tax=Priceomyces carsonii TaxID=28549 RepID=UPI002ED775C7|nr:unnamed protein product [Priceomyces carsonii]
MDISVQSDDVQLLNLSKSKFLSTTRSQGLNKEPRSKHMNTFNLSSLNAQLPPNTGPPGTVPITNGTGSSASSNKNLSHVPCKFYRQGICQAGNSCPFSHNLDGTLAADKLPCKYFQKGNCKFGLKCALAHFLPDGTRVNSKSLMNNSGGGNHHRSSNNASNGSASSSYTGNSVPTVSSQPIDISFDSGEITPPARSNGSPRNGDFSYSGTTLGSNKSSHSGPYSNQDIASLGQLQNHSNSYNSGFTNNPGNSNVGHISLSNALQIHGYRSYSNGMGSNFNVSPLQSSLPYNSPFLQSPPNSSGSYRTSLSSRFPKTQSSASLTYNYTQESAILDDEDEDEDKIYEEDYVPGSLGDLILTPQELQRRDSRSQSGTLLVKPSLGSILGGSGIIKSEEQGDIKVTSGQMNVHEKVSEKVIKTDNNDSSTQEDVFVME